MHSVPVLGGHGEQGQQRNPGREQVLAVELEYVTDTSWSPNTGDTVPVSRRPAESTSMSTSYALGSATR